MICSLCKLFWSSILAKKQCGGVLTKIGDLTQNIENLLMREKCLGDPNKLETRTLAELLTNHLTPHSINLEVIGSIDVCKNHLVSNVILYITARCTH